MIWNKEIKKALYTADAEYAEIRIESIDSSKMSLGDKTLDYIGTSETVGGIVRVLANGAWGCITFTDMKKLSDKVMQACKAARIINKGDVRLAKIIPIIDEQTLNIKHYYQKTDLSSIHTTLGKCSEIILECDNKIVSSSAFYIDRLRRTWFVNSDGVSIAKEKTYMDVGLAAIAREGNNIQKQSYRTGSFSCIHNLQSEAKNIAKKSIELLDAKPVRGGYYTVILDPKLAGVFIHEAFGHLSEADFICENKRLKEILKLGTRLGPKILSVIDDGTIEGLRGTQSYDDEGVPMKKKYLIKNGILVGRLHSRETACNMNENTTGNGISVGFKYPPIVRMTNIYIEKGQSQLRDMIKDIKLGLYAIGAVGGHTELEMFTFTAAYGYMIRNGRIAEMVRNVVLNGNVFETLMNIDMVGNNVILSQFGGNCGKGLQASLPVGFGGPHIRIQKVAVGGSRNDR